MRELVFEKSITVPVSVQRLWEWHMQPGAFERLAPAWQTLEPLEIPDIPGDGEVAKFRLRGGPISIVWHARLGPVRPPYQFVDTQIKGPFASWRHEHIMATASASGALLTDKVTYSLPVWAGSLPIIRSMANAELERLFNFRHARMKADLERFPGMLPGTGKTVLISGSRGLIGGRLVPYLRTLGYTVRGLTRGATGEGLYNWNPSKGQVDPKALESVDAIVHLAGENIASGRWTRERKRRILDSRIQGTRTLVEAASKVGSVKAFVCASGANYYASSAVPSKESAASGQGFLAEVCRKWEAEAMRAEESGIRVVCLRTGVVLDPAGGVLGKLLPVFKAGLGGPVGSGHQGFPWIAMDDLLDIYERAIRDTELEGPVNAVHPASVSQREFSSVLGKTLKRPALLPLPEFVVKGIFGQMGEETLLADLNLRPRALERAKHPFRYPSLAAALSFMLGASRR